MTENPADPLVLGKCTEEENKSVREAQVKINNFFIECGQIDMEIAILEQQKRPLEERKLSLLAEAQKLDIDRKRMLEAIRKRFGIEDGENWQFLPDGTVKRIDPAMIEAMEKARQAAAASRAAEQEEKEEEATT